MDCPPNDSSIERMSRITCPCSLPVNSAISKLDEVELVRVIDMDIGSIEACRKRGLDAIQADALNPPIIGDEKVVCFNLILHHLIGNSEKSTLKMQKDAIRIWGKSENLIFVDEYIYDSYLSNASGNIT